MICRGIGGPFLLSHSLVRSPAIVWLLRRQTRPEDRQSNGRSPLVIPDELPWFGVTLTRHLALARIG